MSSLNVLVAVFIFISSNALATETEIVRDIISIHQSDARRILGREIALRIYETNEAPNAHASYMGPNNGPLLTYYSTLLEEQQDDDVVTVVCHELGHFLGNRGPGVTRSGNAIEGEADYFAGKCAVRYYRMVRGMSLTEAQNTTAMAAQNTFQNLYKIKIDPNRARHMQFAGVNQTYAKPDCRVLSVIHGAMDWKRPVCWYNP
jgi:predicted Zn-dependent protease with MMP-like domain